MPQDITKRSSNIELLRIIAMVMILAHHIAAHSNFVFSTDVITINRFWIQFIQFGGKAAVNVFVLISGYFMVKREVVDHGRTVKFWLQIFSYSAALFLLFVLLGEPFSTGKALYSFLPVTFSAWWFASAYFMLLLLHPYINRFLKVLDKKSYQRLLLLLAFCWSVMPTIFTETLQSNSLLWFMFLYALSGYIRLHVPQIKRKSSFYILWALAVAMLTYLSVLVFDILGTKIPLFATYATFFYSLQKLPSFLIAVLLFVGFLNLKLTYKPFINVIASATFGVYLIHDNTYVREFLWKTLFHNQAHSDSTYLVLYTILQIVVVYTACTAIELFRIYCIERLYVRHIDSLISSLKRGFKRLAESNKFSRIKGFFDIFSS
jgi:surface polysaccharide O-acyltransferase-like enzyme